MTTNPVPVRGLDLTMQEFGDLAPAGYEQKFANLLRRLNEWSEDQIDYLVALDRLVRASPDGSDLMSRVSELESYPWILAAGRFELDGAGDYFFVGPRKNIDSVTLNANSIDVTFPRPLTSTDYSTGFSAPNGGNSSFGVTPSQLRVDRVRVTLFDRSSGAALNPNTTSTNIIAMVYDFNVFAG